MVLIGFEKLLTVTKAVVGTPIDIPVKYRVAQGEFEMAILTCFAFAQPQFFVSYESFCLLKVWPRKDGR